MSKELSTIVNNVDRRPSTFDNNGNSIFDEASVSYAHSKFLRYVADEYIREVKARRKSIEDFYTVLQKLDSHDAKSLLYIKNFLENKSFENIAFDSDDYGNILIEYLKTRQNPLIAFNELIYYKIHNHLPEEYLGWFKDDLRCSLFLAFLVGQSIEHEAYKGRSELIKAVTDYLRYDIHMFISYYYQNFPNYLYQHYRVGERKTVDILYVKSVYMKNRIEDKDIKWIDISNDEQIDWIYDYLDRNDNQHIILKRVFFPESIEEKYELILASLDKLSNIESPEIGTKNKKGYSLRGYVLSSMKKAWDGQQQYAIKNPSSEELSVKIYKKNRDKLDKLVAYSGFTVNKMMNTSIEQIYDHLILNKNARVDDTDE